MFASSDQRLQRGTLVITCLATAMLPGFHHALVGGAGLAVIGAVATVALLGARRREHTGALATEAV